MLGISGTELVIILFFGFLIFGPEKLPQMGRTVGRAIRQFRQASDTMNKKFQDEVKDPFEEAVAPVRDAVNEGTAPIQEDINAINDNLNGIKSTITDPFKDAFNGTSGSMRSTGSSSRPAAAKKPAAVVSGGSATAPAAATTAAAAAAASTAASASSAPASAGTSKASPADDAFVDPFANIANDDAPAAAASNSSTVAATAGSGKPKAQPLPKKGGSVGKSIAAQLYELDNPEPAAAGAAASSAKDGE